jgi:hypothetical protein
MKKTIDDDMLPDYDFSRGVRGKYAARMAKGSNVVVLDRDVQKLFPDSESVNTALRAWHRLWLLPSGRPAAKPRRASEPLRPELLTLEQQFVCQFGHVARGQVDCDVRR